MTALLRNKPYSIGTTFGIDGIPPSVKTAGFPESGNPFVPSNDPTYVFRRETIRDVLNYLTTPGGDGLFLAGHYGAGKTSLIYQAASRLHWPVQAFTAHSRMEFDDLVGTWKLVQGTMQFVHGPLSVAMREGHIFVLNECDRADPGQLTGLHDIVEGHPLVIPTNGGEVIPAHENFRFIATGNSVGSGDNTGLYQGVNILDIAFMDRFRMVNVDYPSVETEHAILANKAGSLPDPIRENMVTVANQIRRLFVGDAEGVTPLTITMSTRTLIRWASLSLTYRNAPNALPYALRISLTSKAEPEQRLAIEQIARDVFGTMWSEDNAA